MSWNFICELNTAECSSQQKLFFKPNICVQFQIRFKHRKQNSVARSSGTVCMSVPAFGNTGFLAGVLVLPLPLGLPRFGVVGVELLLCVNAGSGEDFDWDCDAATWSGEMSDWESSRPASAAVRFLPPTRALFGLDLEIPLRSFVGVLICFFSFTASQIL